jgi:hypothetical protein
MMQNTCKPQVFCFVFFMKNVIINVGTLNFNFLRREIIMKKFIALLLTAAMFCTMSITAFAITDSSIITNTSGNDTADTLVEYGVSEGYTVTIPASVVIGDDGSGEATLEVSNAMLFKESSLQIIIDGDSYDEAKSQWTLTGVRNATLGYTVSNTDGELAPEDVVMEVAAGTAVDATVTEALTFELAEEVLYAGLYNDYLTFTVNVENRPK